MDENTISLIILNVSISCSKRRKIVIRFVLKSS